jgi:hypothetical protein
MPSISNIVAAAAVVALVSAGDAPVAQSDLTTGITYSATLPNSGVDAITGAVIGAISPDGRGTNFQVSFYNLPGSGSLCMFNPYRHCGSRDKADLASTQRTVSTPAASLMETATPLALSSIPLPVPLALTARTTQPLARLVI